jgi:hypothetical protein
MNAILKDKSFQLSIILTTIFIGMGIVFLLAGLVDYSWVLFGLLPIVLGIAIGSMKARKYALWGAVITTMLLLIAIYIPGFSGVICIVMAIGLIVPFIFLGYVISRLMKRYRLLKETDSLPILLLPLIPFLIAAPMEHFLKADKELIVEVRTERIFNYTPEQVFDAIKSVDTQCRQAIFTQTRLTYSYKMCFGKRRSRSIANLLLQGRTTKQCRLWRRHHHRTCYRIRA